MTKSKIPLKAGKLFVLVIFFLGNIPVFGQTLQTNPDSIPFAPAVNYGAGNTPQSVFCADLDGDTDLDLAVANAGSGNVSILKNNGDGTFASAINYGAGTYSRSVFCADLDGDSDLDLAVVNFIDDNVSILKNNGDGTFASAVNYGTGDNPWSVFCADLDGDSDLDLAVANIGSGNVSILKNNGDGTFVSAVNYGAGGNPYSVFCADLDGDTDLDLAVTNKSADHVAILKNNGNGTFAGAVNYGAGSYPISVFCADLDGDTDLDLAVANFNSNNVSILKNNGNGTFVSAVNYGAGGNPYSVFCADLDGDSDLDLAVANWGDSNVSILKNNGDGTFACAVNYGAGNHPYFVFCADLDGDSDLDLALANHYGGDVSILINLTIASEPFYFVHITDPHVHHQLLPPDRRWPWALEEIASWDPPPDFVLCSGDLTPAGQAWNSDADWQALLEPLHQQSGKFYINEQHTIPIYFCPGNHDAANWKLYPTDFTNYHNYIGPDYYNLKHKSCALFSLNTGKDLVSEWPNPHPKGDGMDNQYGNEVTQFPADLDLLDGVVNGTDNSWYDKVVMMHHPYINPKDGSSDECFQYNRGSFINSCFGYGVDLALCGHMHKGGRYGTRNQYGDPWQQGDGTKFVITNALSESFAHREFQVSPGKGVIDVGEMQYFASTISFELDGQAMAHVYDDNGNHDGPDSNGVTQISIPYSQYEFWVGDSVEMNPIFTEFSVLKEDTTDYAFTITSQRDSILDISVTTTLVGGVWNEARYDSVQMYEGSVATLQAVGSVLDYTMSIVDPDSSEREVTPSNWQGNLPPVEPTTPSGPTMVVSKDSSAYGTSSTDPENDQVLYKFDWGNETYSDWQGPFNSGDSCLANHRWIEAGTYNVRVRAIDIWDHMGEWSDPLLVTVRDRGDANGDGVIDVGDVVSLINYLFKNGPSPIPLQAGDANCDGLDDVGDVVYLINYLFKSGPSPCSQ